MAKLETDNEKLRQEISQMRSKIRNDPNVRELEMAKRKIHDLDDEIHKLSVTHDDQVQDLQSKMHELEKIADSPVRRSIELKLRQAEEDKQRLKAGFKARESLLLDEL